MTYHDSYQTPLFIVAAIFAILATIYGVFKTVYRTGRKDEKREDEIELLKKDILDIRSDLQNLTDQADQDRKEIRDCLKKITESQNEMKISIAYVRGKMAKRDSSSPSS